MSRACLALIGFALMAACTPFPDLDDRVGPEARSAPYPVLVPTGPLLAEGTGAADADAAAAPVLGRASDLQRRAAGINATGPVVDPATRERLRRARAAVAAQDG